MPFDDATSVQSPASTPRPAGQVRAPDITAWVRSADTTYWDAHPDVCGIVCTAWPDEGGEKYRLNLWLMPAPGEASNPVEPMTRRPARNPDFEIFGEGEPHPTFIDRLPASEHLEVFCEQSWDEAYPDGWWVARIWVS